MFLEAALLGWSGLALVWWVISWWLVWRSRGNRGAGINEAQAEGSLTVFKPLPPLDGSEFDPKGLESFLAQLDADAEMLLGVHAGDRARVEPWVRRMSEMYREARLRVIWRSTPDEVTNPKIAWMKILAPNAAGDLWLWSDADIVAPPGFLQAARAEYGAGGARLVTWPYAVREIAASPAVLDALYVNVEFLPGVLLLRRLGTVDFGLGAAMIFSRTDFEACVGWDEPGRALADDFVLGQKLQPVRIGQAILTTSAEVGTWLEAGLHYLRWSKTVRWNRAGGTAARIVVLPVVGWLAWVACHPLAPFGWIGLGVMLQVDVLAAFLISRASGCATRVRDVLAVEAWALGRVFAWLGCWLPWPVTWRGQRWHGPIATDPGGN